MSADINLYLDTASSTGSTGTDLAFYTAGKKFNGQPTWHDSGLSGPWNGGSPGATAYSTRHFGGTGLTGYKAFDGMVGLIQGWADGSIAHTGLVLKQVTESDNRQLWFYSSSTATSNDGKRPYLDVTYDLPAEHLMSGVVLDGSGVPVAGANVSISVENDQVDTGRTDELPLVHGVTNQNGGFSLTGNYIGPATLNDDGSMRLQVALSSPDLDRFYLINAMPPSDAGGTWTWSSAPDTAAVGHPADADDMVGTAVTDLRFILDPQQGVVPTPSAPTSSGGSTALAADGSTTMSYSADSPGSISAADVADSGANYPVAEEYDPDDPTGADATNPTTNAAAEEADAAREFRPCATGSGETWWEGLDSYKRRYTPIWYSNIAGNATEHYDWKTTTMTLIKPAIVGAGANYAGGLSLSVEKNHATNVSQTYNTAYVKQYFGVQWKFREQKLMCFNAGYTYDTGRRRWFPINFTTGAKNISTSYDFTCKAVNKATTSAQETTIADGKSVTFDLSFSIGLGDMQKYNDDESHVTYKKRATANSYTLCGKGADPGQAKIVKEVVS